MAETSTKPYLIRAIHEWCTDNGFTPYVAVAVDARTRVPMEHVRNNEIVLNVSPLATNRLHLGNDVIEFQARFGGVPRDLSIPVDNVTAIYARENGHGMAFEVTKLPTEEAAAADAIGVDPSCAIESDRIDESATPLADPAKASAPADGAAGGKAPQLVAVPSSPKPPSARRSKQATTEADKPAEDKSDAEVSAELAPTGNAEGSAPSGDPEQPDPTPTKPRQPRPKLTRIK